MTVCICLRIGVILIRDVIQTNQCVAEMKGCQVRDRIGGNISEVLEVHYFYTANV